MGEKKDCKNIIRVLAIVLEVFCFLPTMTVSCAGVTRELGVVDLFLGVGDEEMTIIEPQYICFIALIIPIIMIFFWNKKTKTYGVNDQKIRLFIFYIITVVDIIFWIMIKYEMSEKAKEMFCDSSVTMLYYLNLLCLIVILCMLVASSLGIFAFGGTQLTNMQNSNYTPSNTPTVSAVSGRFCSHCGKAVRGDNLFCENCGNKIDNNQFVNANTTTKTAGGRENGTLLKRIIVGVVACVLVVGLGSYIWNERNNYVFLDLEEYMDCDKDEWINRGFKEKDGMLVSDDECIVVLLDGEKPYMLSVEKTGDYSYHGIKTGMDKDEATTLIQQSYDEIADLEIRNVFEHKTKKLWLSLCFDNDKVSSLDVSTEKDMILPDEAMDYSGDDEYTEETEPEVEEMPEEIFDDTTSDYIIPYSDRERITESDIEYLSLQEINYAKNEIYARHGRKFKSRELNEYFNSKSWYCGTIDPEDFSEDMLSQVEKDNVKMLSELEFSIDPNGYQLDK